MRCIRADITQRRMLPSQAQGSRYTLVKLIFTDAGH
ncbi:uncharacterized protein METZ01_LOCUS380454 [marine metagenome]|uniref:Uncharacterized protein n=1 Tax=marine metagenome TaxID=408172 RepID=A0A382TZX3_9ZZZZ